MDFQHTFRQAHQDRLEDAGTNRSRPADGFGVLKPKRDTKQAVVKKLRPVLTTLINLIAK